MRLQGCSALVTGANRGLGRALVHELLLRGATVYAGARDPRSIVEPGVIPVALDVTDAEQIARVAAELEGISLLVNNAGVMHPGESLALPSLDSVRAELEVNALGPLALTRAFAPTLAANGGGAVVDVLSVLSWLAFPALAGYGASKAAAWSLTNALRLELRPQRTLVTSVFVGYMDTRMAAGVTDAKNAPEDVAGRIAVAVEAGQEELIVDAASANVRSALSSGLDALYPRDREEEVT